METVREPMVRGRMRRLGMFGPVFLLLGTGLPVFPGGEPLVVQAAEAAGEGATGGLTGGS